MKMKMEKGEKLLCPLCKTLLYGIMILPPEKQPFVKGQRMDNGFFCNRCKIIITLEEIKCGYEEVK